MAIAMNELKRNTPAKSMAYEDASESHPLSLLSSIAAAISDKPTEYTMLEPRQKRSKEHIGETANNSLTGPGRPEKVGRLSRSLSRSRSTRNLQKSCSLFSTLEEWEPQMPQPPLRKKRTQHGSLPSMTCAPPMVQAQLAATNCKSSQTIFRNEDAPCAPPMAQAQLAATNCKSSPMIFQKENAPCAPQKAQAQLAATNCKSSPMIFGEENAVKDTEQLLATKTTSKEKEVEAAIGHLTPDEISKNLYRAYEMQLPESCSMSHISSYSNAKVEDDYNYDVYTFSPLHDPPRLPNSMETYEIAERSKEEKNNWGWYA